MVPRATAFLLALLAATAAQVSAQCAFEDGACLASPEYLAGLDQVLASAIACSSAVTCGPLGEVLGDCEERVVTVAGQQAPFCFSTLAPEPATAAVSQVFTFCNAITTEEECTDPSCEWSGACQPRQEFFLAALGFTGVDAATNFLTASLAAQAICAEATNATECTEASEIVLQEIGESLVEQDSTADDGAAAPVADSIAPAPALVDDVVTADAPAAAPADAVDTPAPAPLLADAPAPAPIAADAPAPAPIAADAPAPADIVAEAPVPAPVAADAPAPAPAVADAPAPAPVVADAPAPAPVVADAPAPAPLVADAPAPAPVVADAPAPAPLVADAPAPAPAGDEIATDGDGIAIGGSAPADTQTPAPTPEGSSAPRPSLSGLAAAGFSCIVLAAMLL